MGNEVMTKTEETKKGWKRTTFVFNHMVKMEEMESGYLYTTYYYLFADDYIRYCWG